jgi:DNA-directed RNA polymerase subunit RPC12/RpoP
MLKTVASFTDPVEAHFAKTLLEAEGIPAAISGDSLSNLDVIPLGNTVGYVNVQVHHDDYDKALEILSKEPDGATDDDSLKEPESDEADNPDAPTCPKCGSKEICKPRLTTFGYLLALFMLDFSKPAASNKWKCLDCGHEWDAP